jgi:hypothetical protein
VDAVGWTVANHRAPGRAFSNRTDAGIGGFTLCGFGSATVPTPPSYQPGTAHQEVVAGPSGSTTGQVVADSAGRLTIDVGLHTPLDLTPGTGRVTIG